MSDYQKHIILGLSLVLIFSLGTLVEAEDAKVIEVEGVSYVNNNNLAAAEEKAINNGLRRAVEQAVGTYVDSSTKVKNAQLIEDEILKNSRGYVKSYQVLAKNKQNNNLRVKLRVKVGSKDLVSDLDALKMNIKRHGNPRVMFLISQIKEGYHVNLSSSVVSNKLMNKFIASGFRVIDQAQIKKVVDDEQRKAIIQGDYGLAAKLGVQLNADLVVTGDARASHIDLSDVYDGDLGDTLKSYSSNINSKVINTATAEVVAAVSANAKGAGGNKESAARKALTKAADILGQKLVDNVSKQIIQEDKTINLKIDNLRTVKQLQELRTVLPSVAGVNNVYFRSYNDSLGVFDLDLASRTQAIDVALDLEKKVSYNFSIMSMSASKLILKIK